MFNYSSLNTALCLILNMAGVVKIVFKIKSFILSVNVVIKVYRVYLHCAKKIVLKY